MTKIISLSEEAYSKLKAIKGDRSFSDVVIEFTNLRKKRSILDFAGAFKDNADEWKNIKKMIEEDRKKFKLREVKF